MIVYHKKTKNYSFQMFDLVEMQHKPELTQYFYEDMQINFHDHNKRFFQFSSTQKDLIVGYRIYDNPNFNDTVSLNSSRTSIGSTAGIDYDQIVEYIDDNIVSILGDDSDGYSYEESDYDEDSSINPGDSNTDWRDLDPVAVGKVVSISESGNDKASHNDYGSDIYENKNDQTLQGQSDSDNLEMYQNDEAENNAGSDLEDLDLYTNE